MSASGRTGPTAAEHAADEVSEVGPAQLPCEMSHRRSFLRIIAASSCTLAAVTSASLGEDAHASDASLQPSFGFARSFARGPVESLVPACRVRVRIEDALRSARDLAASNSSESAQEGKKPPLQEIAVRLDRSLLGSQTFFEPADFQKDQSRADNSKPGGNSLLDSIAANSPRPSPVYSSEFQSSSKSLPLWAVPQASLQRNGQIDTWKRLQRSERAREQTNQMRKAFNAYTASLTYDATSYQITATAEEKKKFLRSYDGLPEVRAVVTSDLDLRDLFRNQVLTSWEDAAAEWATLKTLLLQQGDLDQGAFVPLKDDAELFDASDLVSILEEAQTACLKWFSFIPEDDVNEALALVNAQ